MNIGELIDHYQEWVDYDMKRYGKISDETNRDIEEAGLQIVKDKYGDYEVIAGKYNESLKGENGWIKRWKFLDNYYKGDLVISKISFPCEAWHIEKVAPNGRTIKHLGNYKSLEVAMDAAEQYLKKYTNNFSESLKEDTQLKFDGDMINDIDVLYGWRPQEVERILIKHGSDKNNDNWIDGLDLPAAYDEIMSTFRDKYSDDDEIDYDAAKVLGLIDESLKESLRMSRDDFDRMCKENGILQGLSRRDYMEIRDLFHAGSESFDSAVNDLWHGDDDFHSRDWYENLLKKYIDQESLKEAKKLRAPKFWNTNFSDNVIKDYEAGKLTFDNIEEWDTAYNDGRKPNPPFNTKEILDYYLATKDTPTESAIKESVTFSDYMLDKNSVLHLTSDLLKDYNTTTSTTFICPKDEYFLVELSVDDGQHLLQCPHCQIQYGYDEDDIEATFDIL